MVLGEGGMGAVWAATNVVLDAPVAIKLIRGDLSRDAFAARLHQEARAAARLGHPAIVRVFDVGETSHGDPFIVMELLEGRSLSALLMEEGRLAPVQAIQLLLPIAEALSVAHAKGIVHRDLKPDNVFLAADDGRLQPKLVDFGIAKLEPRVGASNLTHGGVVLGSPEYMSPEQARGEATLDARSDVWSFCVVLFESMTGVLPFTGQNYNAQLRAILEDTPKGLRDYATGDLELSMLVATGLAKDRDLRFRSMNELGTALARWLLAQGIYEDACGASIQSKWLDRASRTSIPDFSMPLSGVRPTEPRALVPTTPGIGASKPPEKMRALRLLSERPFLRVALPVAGLVVLALALALLFRQGSGEARTSHDPPEAARTSPPRPPARSVPEADPRPPQRELVSPAPTTGLAPAATPEVATTSASTAVRPVEEPRSMVRPASGEREGVEPVKTTGPERNGPERKRQEPVPAPPASCEPALDLRAPY
jgi:serine/threonine-protein kinase